MITETSTTLPSSPTLRPYPPAPSGNPLWGSRAPPQTDVIMFVVSLCTGLWGPRGRGSAHPKVADTRRPRPQGNNSRRSVAHHRTRHAAPAGPLGPPATVTPGRLLASPVSPLKGQTDWILSPSTTTRWPAPGGVWWLWWLWWTRASTRSLCRQFGTLLCNASPRQLTAVSHRRPKKVRQNRALNVQMDEVRKRASILPKKSAHRHCRHNC